MAKWQMCASLVYLSTYLSYVEAQIQEGLLSPTSESSSLVTGVCHINCISAIVHIYVCLTADIFISGYMVVLLYRGAWYPIIYAFPRRHTWTENEP